MLKRFLAALLALMLAVPLQAAEIGDFDSVDANNTLRWPEGMPFAQVNDSARADEGILARFWKDVNGSLTTTGSANAYAVAANQTLTAYYAGLWIRAKANFTNTGAATMNFDTLGAKAVKKEGNVDVEAGDIVSGRIYDWVYDGTNIQLLQLNTLRDGIVSTAKIADSAVTSAKILDGTIAWTDLASGIFNQSTTTPALGDLIPFADVSASGARQVATVSSILALTGSVAGVNGLTIVNNAGTPTTRLDVSCSEALLINTGGAGVHVLAQSLTLDAATTGANGLDTGTLAANSWYYIYLINNGTTTASLLSLSSSSPTMPGGYTFKYRVGAQRTNGSAQFLRIIQKGNEAHYQVVAASTTPNLPIINSANLTTYTAVSISSFFPPVATRIIGAGRSSSSTGALSIAPNGDYGDHNNTTNPTPCGSESNSGAIDIICHWNFIPESTNIYIGSDSAQTYAIGWVDAVNAN